MSKTYPGNHLWSTYLDIRPQLPDPNNELVVEVDHDIVSRWHVCHQCLWSHNSQAVPECSLVCNSQRLPSRTTLRKVLVETYARLT
jgi:hypothetical protein